MNLFKGKDFLFIGVLGFNIIFFTGLFYYDLHKDISAGENPDIAVATLKINTVQRKYENHPSWKNLYQNSLIKDGDTIRTDSDSDAVIQFNDGTEIQLDENSLIKINFSKNPKIEFDKGTMQIKSNSGKVTVDTKNSNTNFQKGNYRMEKGVGENYRLSSDNGSSVVVINGKEIKFGENEEILIGENVERKNKDIILKTPINQEKIILTETQTKVIFNYSLIGKFESPTLQISNKRNFSSLIIDQKISGNSIDINLPEGNYFWKIKARREGKNLFSESRKFTVLKDSSIVLFSPTNETTFPLSRDSLSVLFTWSQNQVSNRYKLEYANNSKLQNPIVKEVNLTSITLEGFKKGRYFWRVSTIPSYGNSKPKTSPIFSFTVGLDKEEKIAPDKQNFKKTKIPLESLQPNEKKVQITKDSPLRFAWEKQDSADKYNFSLYDRNGQKKKIYESKTKNNQLNFQKFDILREGDFSWEVYGINKQGDASEKTEGSFQIKAQDELMKLKPGQIKILSPETIYRD